MLPYQNYHSFTVNSVNSFFYSEAQTLPGLHIEVQGFAVVSISVGFPVQPQVPFLHLMDFQPETSIQVLYVPPKFPDLFFNPTCSFYLTRCRSYALVQYSSHTLPIETGRLLLSSRPAGKSRRA